MLTTVTKEQPKLEHIKVSENTQPKLSMMASQQGREDDYKQGIKRNLARKKHNVLFVFTMYILLFIKQGIAYIQNKARRWC